MRGKRITLLCLLNTITRRLLGRVLVKVVRVSDSQVLRYYWDAADKHPREREYKCE